MNGSSAYNEWAAPDQGDGPDVEQAMREQHSRAMRAILDASRVAVADVVTGRRAQYPTPEELAGAGLAAVFEPAPLPCQDDLTMRPRPCGCVGTEQSCQACRFAATISALNEHAQERRKPYVFDVADGRLRAQMGGMTIRFFFDATDAWAWEGAQ